MNRFLSLFVVSTILFGCSSTFQGIRMRAQAPPIDEGFRKLSLAITLDGFQIETIDPAAFRLSTGWRPLKEKDFSPNDLTYPPGAVEGRLVLRLEKRSGAVLYDVFLVPMLRYTEKGTAREVVAGVRHPFWEKWQRVVTSFIEKEAREED
jgi:hypothetical protein